MFTQAHPLAPTLTSVEEAMIDPAGWLEKLAAKVAASWSLGDRVSPPNLAKR
jgi:hypothetical protein